MTEMDFIHMQNQVISGMLKDMDKLTSMIMNIHKEQEYIKRVFLMPMPPPARPDYVPHNPSPRPKPVQRPVSVPQNPSPRPKPVQRPVSVPQKLPSIAPRPPTAVKKGRGAPRKLPSRPVMVF